MQNPVFVIAIIFTIALTIYLVWDIFKNRKIKREDMLALLGIFVGVAVSFSSLPNQTESSAEVIALMEEQRDIQLTIAAAQNSNSSSSQEIEALQGELDVRSTEIAELQSSLSNEEKEAVATAVVEIATATTPPEPTETKSEPTQSALPTSTSTELDASETATSTTQPTEQQIEIQSKTESLTGIRQILIPAGAFDMGTEQFDNASPVHSVYIDDFWIDQTEVTNQQYAIFLNDIGSHENNCNDFDCIVTQQESRNGTSKIQSTTQGYSVEDGFASHPVINVSWFGAAAFCEWRGGRLPTEAEWEKSAGWNPAKAQSTTYPWGNQFDGEKLNYCDSNCAEIEDLEGLADNRFDDGNLLVAPVGSYREGLSFYGAADMSGNVWEWVNDWYGEQYYSSIFASDPNPTGPDSGEHKVARGGSWNSVADHLVTTFRGHRFPETLDWSIGFRCVETDNNN